MCCLFKKKKLPTRAEISHNDLRALLQAKFPVVPLYLSDNVFRLCDITDIEKFLDLDETNKIKYQAEKMDCDDFAYRLMGQLSIPPWSNIAFGICWTDKHALNLMVDNNGDIWFIEPQTDACRSSLEDWQGSNVQFVIM